MAYNPNAGGVLLTPQRPVADILAQQMAPSPYYLNPTVAPYAPQPLALGPGLGPGGGGASMQPYSPLQAQGGPTGGFPRFGPAGTAGAADDLAGAAVGQPAAAAAASSRWAAMRASAPTSNLARIGAPLAGSLAGGVLSNALGPDTLAGKFAAGAGTGAGLGYTIAGPWGALGGGALGGLLSATGVLDDIPFLGGGDSAPSSDEIKSTLFAAIDRTSLPADLKANLVAGYDTLLAAATTDEERAAVADQIAAATMTAIQSREQQAQSSANALALQSVIADYMAPYAEQMTSSAQAQSDMTTQLLSTLPAAYRPIAQMQAASNLNSASRTASAYMMQAQMIPAMAQIDAQQGYQAQVNQQLQAQAISAQMGTGGGAIDFNQIVPPGT